MARPDWLGCTLVALALLACGGSETPVGDVGEGASTEPVSAAPAPTDPAEAAPVDDGEEIDEDSLREAGSVVIEQYQVAWVGSGTLGKGTLRYGGRDHTFRIGGLGVGGLGVAAIDAHGTVYDLPDLQSFAGSYGNARLGATAADKGKGRLWLKNTNGVVIKLWTKMEGLALTGGVDGIVIEWESEVQEAAQEVKEAPGEAWDAVKKPFE